MSIQNRVSVVYLDVAQPGRVLPSEGRSRGIEARHLDHLTLLQKTMGISCWQDILNDLDLYHETRCPIINYASMAKR
jgi:hypothetical protein